MPVTDVELHHPLAHLLAVRCLTAGSYLRRVADQHAAMGYGPLAYRREKVSRWIAGTHSPSYHTQLAMAALEGISAEAVHDRGWPGWLTLALPDDRTVLCAPWTTAGTVAALEITGGGPVDRRRFLITTSVTLGTTMAQWSGAAPAGASPAHGRRIGQDVPDLFDRRLDDLRRLDDRVGSGDVYDAARTELRLITRTIKDATYSATTARRLHAAAAEASRAAGWTAYDSGKTAAADRHYITALRSAADAGDPVISANTMAFWAIQHYSTGDPRGAVDLVDTALTQAPRIGSARMTAMLYARACRAHARAGDSQAADRAANAALTAYENAVPAGDDLPCVYWVNLGEIHQLLGSSALNLGHPKIALRHFQDASTAATSEAEAYDSDAFPRGASIYLARLAEAQLDLGDIDAAIDTAHNAVDHMGGVTSARGTSTLEDLRKKLAQRRGVPVVRDFLTATA